MFARLHWPAAGEEEEALHAAVLHSGGGQEAAEGGQEAMNQHGPARGAPGEARRGAARG